MMFICLHRWMVGLSYRLLYRRDPVPDNKSHAINLLGQGLLVHVHGEIYIDDTTCMYDARPEGLQSDMADHTWDKYSKARFAALSSALCGAVQAAMPAVKMAVSLICAMLVLKPSLTCV